VNKSIKKEKEGGRLGQGKQGGVGVGGGGGVWGGVGWWVWGVGGFADVLPLKKNRNLHKLEVGVSEDHLSLGGFCPSLGARGRGCFQHRTASF